MLQSFVWYFQQKPCVCKNEIKRLLSILETELERFIHWPNLRETGLKLHWLSEQLTAQAMKQRGL